MGNMSKTAKFVVILLIVTIASFAIAGLIFYEEYGKNNFADLNGDVFKPSGSVDVDETKTGSVTGIENIYINTPSDDINIIKTDSGELKAHFHGYYSTSVADYKPEFTLTSGGGDMRIKVEYRPVVGQLRFNSNLKLDVYLPAGYAKNLEIGTASGSVRTDGINALESFTCKTASGDLEAGPVNARTARLQSSSGNAAITGEYGSFEFQAASGEFRSEGIKADSASLRTASGNIRLKGSIGDLKLNSTSGEVLAEQLIAGTCKAETTSGSVTLKGNPGKLEASASSGEIRLQYDEFASDITLRTISGDAFIKLPQDAQFRLDYDTVSGDKKIDFPITINGNSKEKGVHGTVVSDRNYIKVSTTSGSLEITK